MPETFIIYRFKYKDNLAEEWRKKFHALSENEAKEARAIIEANTFTDEVLRNASCDSVRDVLSYYCLERG